MFCHRMALELSMTVAEIRERMTAEELLDWLEYFERTKPKESDGKIDPSQVDPKDLARAFGARV